MILATLTAANLSLAQVCFLLAAFTCVIAAILGLSTYGRANFWATGVLLVLVLFLVSVGLLFAF